MLDGRSALPRFLVVGGAMAAASAGAIALLVDGAHWSPLAAAVAVAIGGNLIGFLVNRHWSFAAGSGHLRRQLTRYALLAAGSALAGVALFALFTQALGMQYVIASLAVSATLAGATFVGHWQWTFVEWRKGNGKDRGKRKRPRRVLLVTHYYPAHGGGIERVAGELAARLGGTRLAIDWFASAGDPLPLCRGVECHPQWAWNGLEERLGLPIPLWTPWAYVRVMAAAARADVVHVHDLLYPANFLAALVALALRRRLVVTQHVGAIPYRQVSLRKLLRSANAITGRLILRRADAAVFISLTVQRYFEWLVGDTRRFCFQPNGVDTELFSPHPWGVINGVRPRLLFVGRYVEKKGLAMIRELAARNPQWDWVLIGSGSERPRDWGLANVTDLGRLRQSGLVRFYREADLLCLPSVGEGFPLVVQEALACGTPVLVNTETQEAAALPARVCYAEPVEGSDAIGRWEYRIREHLARSRAQRSEVRKACRAYAEAQWSWAATAKFYRELYYTSKSLAPAAAVSEEPVPESH